MKQMNERMRRQQEKEMLRYDKKMQKWKEKRRMRINRRIERTVSFLAILITVVFSVLEVMEKGERKFTFGRFNFKGMKQATK